LSAATRSGKSYDAASIAWPTDSARTPVVAGEAGVGKSRLLREASEDGVRRGARVRTGRTVERDSPLSAEVLAACSCSRTGQSRHPWEEKGADMYMMREVFQAERGKAVEIVAAFKTP
jgi:hypothetical protein